MFTSPTIPTNPIILANPAIPTNPTSDSNFDFIQLMMSLNFMRSIAVSQIINSSSTSLQNGWTLDDLILSCYFNGKPCNSSQYWTPFYSYEYGNCYTFNKNPSEISTSKLGSLNNLQMEVFLGDLSKLFCFKAR
jgi:hypothetical protein